MTLNPSRYLPQPGPPRPPNPNRRMQDARDELAMKKFHLINTIADVEVAQRAIAFDAAAGDPDAKLQWSEKHAQLAALRIELKTLVQAQDFANERAHIEITGGRQTDRQNRIAQGKSMSATMKELAAIFDAHLKDATDAYAAFQEKGREIIALGFNTNQISSCIGYRPLVQNAVDAAGLGGGTPGSGATPLASAAANYLGLPVSDDRIPMDW